MTPVIGGLSWNYTKILTVTQSFAACASCWFFRHVEGSLQLLSAEAWQLILMQHAVGNIVCFSVGPRATNSLFS